MGLPELFTDELRALLARAVVADLGGEGAESLLEDLRRLRQRLERLPRRPRWYEAPGPLSPLTYLDHSPFAGRLHPMAPPVVLERRDDRVVGRVTFGLAHEGPPGAVHGGVVAGVFDEVLGAAQFLSGAAGYTGLLTVRYRSLTPLHTEVVVEARVDRVAGRRITASATATAGGRVTAEATAVFVSAGYRPNREPNELRKGTHGTA